MTERTIVMVEDSEDDAYLIRRRLTEHIDEPFHLVHFTKMAHARQFVKEHKDEIMLILLDLGLPDTKGGRDTFANMSPYSGDIPVVILTSVEDHDLAVGLVNDGAQHFVNKALLYDRPDLIRDAVDFAITRHRKMRESISEKDAVISWMSGGYSAGQ